MPLFTKDVAALLDLEIWLLRSFIDYYSESTVAHDDHRGMASIYPTPGDFNNA